MAHLRLICSGNIMLVASTLFLFVGCSAHPNTSGEETSDEVSSGGNTLVIGGENAGSAVNGNNMNIVQDNAGLVISGNNADSSGSINANGIRYEIQGAHRLEMKNGRLLVNGKDFGPVQKGDNVSLTGEGRLSVNNQQREESAP